MGYRAFHDDEYDIGTAVDPAAAALLQPLVREIHLALQQLLDCGESTMIDLCTLRLGSHNEAALKRILGDGEVSALVQAFGESEVEETGYAGVWWVVHRDPEGEVIGKAIEVAFLPSILHSQRDDVAGALARLNQATAQRGPGDLS